MAISDRISSCLTAAAQKLSGEAAHKLAVQGLFLMPPLMPYASKKTYDSRLGVRVAGLDWPNPLGLAAGFDKDGVAIAGALSLGFGATEVGTITPKPQAGNPKPRVFRLLDDEAVINRYGFNSGGMEAAEKRLAKYRKKYPLGKAKGILGVNIGANKDSPDRINDYFEAASSLAQHADYVTVNVSSPNTPGLRGLQEADSLRQVIQAAQAGMKSGGSIKPLMLKIAPDLDDDGVKSVLDIALDEKCSAVIIANTTISRPDGLTGKHASESGGLSGKPLFDLSNKVLNAAYQHLKSKGRAESLPIIAAGGISSPEDALIKILLGASLVQIYTALIFKGHLLPRDILLGMGKYLRRNNHASITELTGTAASIAEAEKLSKLRLPQ